MYQIKATLRSKTDPALGSVTIQFPIHRKEYDRVLEQLKPLGIGSPLGQDCQIETLDSHYPILKRLEETLVNLDYLAKRLDNIDEKATTFQGAAAAEGITSIQDFINLTFCYKQVSVVCMAESRLYRVLERSGVIDPKNFELCYIDQAPYELCPYAEQITKALEDYRMPEVAERGIMHWYYEE